MSLNIDATSRVVTDFGAVLEFHKSSFPAGLTPSNLRTELNTLESASTGVASLPHELNLRNCLLL